MKQSFWLQMINAIRPSIEKEIRQAITTMSQVGNFWGWGLDDFIVISRYM